jgi:hypothetical protein
MQTRSMHRGHGIPGLRECIGAPQEKQMPVSPPIKLHAQNLILQAFTSGKRNRLITWRFGALSALVP